MKSILLKIAPKKTITTFTTCIVLIGLMLLGCTSTKTVEQTIILPETQPNTTPVQSSTTNTAVATQEFGLDNHSYISQIPALIAPILSHANDSLVQNVTITEEIKIVAPLIVVEEFADPNIRDIKSPVADKLVENYLNSENKEPSGHCLAVSKGRFEQAYKEVYGHLLYQDLPKRMASKYYTAKQVFNFIYDSASGIHDGWRSLPEDFRGKGNAGAIAYAGMGTLVDTSGIWSGELRPGALVQVWRFKVDYEKVVEGVNVKKLDPYGHSFIFISYVRDAKNEIIGLKIADQGFQSYRPLIPRDYEVWWAVNLSV